MAGKLSLAAALDRLLIEPTFVEALYTCESLQTLVNEVERMQAFSEIVHVHQRNVLAFLRLALESEDSHPSMIWNYVAEQLLSIMSDDLVDEDFCAKVFVELKGLAVVLDASRYEGSQRLSLLKESMNQIFEVKEDFSEKVVNYISLKNHEIYQLFKDATSSRKFKAAISKYLKKYRQETLNQLQALIRELEKAYGEPWLYRMCKQLYGLLPGRTKVGKSKRRMSEPPSSGEQLSGLHLDVSEVKKVLESHYSSLSAPNDEESGSEEKYLRMLPRNTMPSLNYSILKKDTCNAEPSSQELQGPSSSDAAKAATVEPETNANKTPDKVSRRGILTEPQPNAKEVTWDSLPSTERDGGERENEKPLEANSEQKQSTSSVTLRRVEKRRISPMKPEENSDGAGATRKKKHSYHRWDDHQDYLLKKGIEKHGLGEWKAILDDPELDWPSYRTNVQLKDRARTLKII